MSDVDQQPQPPSPELVARARAYRDSGGSPVPAKASATVILLRDGPKQLEVFMIRRHTGMLFAGGMYVFPGGVVDAADQSAATSSKPMRSRPSGRPSKNAVCS